MLSVSHVIVGVTNLGPDKRICIWFSGCSKHCAGCCAPELQSADSGKLYSCDDLALFLNCKLISTGIDSITISGGDPLEQNKEEFIAFLKQLLFKDILIYTGYTEEDIKKLGWYEPLSEIGVTLVCGRYIKDQDKGHPLMGSSNQTMIFFNPENKYKYDKWICYRGREIQLYRSEDKIYYTGLASLKEE